MKYDNSKIIEIKKIYKMNIINKLKWIFYNSNLFITKFIIKYFIAM